MKRISILFLLVPLVSFAQPDLSLVEIADGYNRPCEIVNAGDERLFVVEQTGRIKILYTNGETESTPFLNLSNQVDSQGNEKGLLGLVFAPDYCTSGNFYVNYTTTISNQLYTHISRFSVDPDNENEALPASEEVLMEFEQDFSNHNGGHIEFGPDGYLYIGTGDGGSGGDPNNRAQNIMSHLGKMLRIDVSTDPYSIPDDNPFAFDDFGLDEIWAYGLRNPWKFAFDSETGDLFIGDVGQSNREEVSFQAAGTTGGLNYGWRCYEGTASYNLSECDDVGVVTDPITDYAYGSGGNGFRCAITGGRIYRGNSFPEMFGKYLYVDYCSDEYWLINQNGDSWDITSGTNLGNETVSFGEDVWGEMYAIDGGDGSVHRVEEASGEYIPHIVQVSNNTLQSSLEGASYAWYLNGELIDGADTQSITFSTNGTYAVVITSESGCEIEANPADAVLSTGDHESLNTFAIYPNPSNGLVNLNVETNYNIEGDSYVRILGVDGKLLIEKRFVLNGIVQSMDLSSLNKGIYFVQLVKDNGLSLGVRRMVIE